MSLKLTLDDLINHAEKKPDHTFLLGSCSECLVCDIIRREHEGEDGRPDVDYTQARWLGDDTVYYEQPDVFVDFLIDVSDNIPDDSREVNNPFTGAQVARALRSIRDGVDAETAALNMIKERYGDA